MKEYIVYLRPKSPLKDDIPSANTIFGALCWGIRETSGESPLLELLDRCREKNPPFIISSCLPKIDNRHLMPRPVLKTEVLRKLREKITGAKELEVEHKVKRLARQRFVSVEQFNKIFKQRDFQEEPLPEWHSNRIWIRTAVARTAMKAMEGALFYENVVFLKKDVALYLIFRFFDEGWLSCVEKALEWCKYSGIGGDRSVGFGHYEISSPVAVKIEDGSANCEFVTLSPYLPDEGEMKVDESFYEIMPFTGRVESRAEFKSSGGFCKKTVIYIKEGSIICPVERKQIYGVCPDVYEKDGRKVIQYGFAFPVWGSIVL